MNGLNDGRKMSRRGVGFWVVAILVIIGVPMVCIMLLGTRTPSHQAQKETTPDVPSQTVSKTEEQPLLDLLSYSTSRDASGFFAEVNGEVKNITNQNLEDIFAVATFHDENKNILTSAVAVLEFNPLSPNQTSPFKIMTPYNSAMDNVDISFKFVSGKVITVIYHTDTATSP